MKIFHLNKCINKTLNGKYDWMVSIFHKDTFFADYTIRGVHTFDTEKMAIKDCNRIIKLLKIHSENHPKKNEHPSGLSMFRSERFLHYSDYYMDVNENN